MLVRIPVGLDAGRVPNSRPEKALTSSRGMVIIPVEVTQMTQPGEKPSDRIVLTWLGRFEAIQGLTDTSDWLYCALEFLKERDPEDARNDTELLWRLSAIRADEVMAEASLALKEIGLHD